MGRFVGSDLNRRRRHPGQRKEFIIRDYLIPCRKILRMRAKYNMLREGIKPTGKESKHEYFRNHWREHAAE